MPSLGLAPPTAIGRRYPPYSKDLCTLDESCLGDLKQDTHHADKAPYLKIERTVLSARVFLTVEDTKVALEKIHLLCNVFQAL